MTIGLPLRSSGQLAGAFSETWFANVLGLVIFPLAIPWGYVIAKYVREPGRSLAVVVNVLGVTAIQRVLGAVW